MLNIYEIAKLRHLFEEGYSYKDIEHLTGCNYRTIKKYISLKNFEEPEVPPKDKKGIQYNL